MTEASIRAQKFIEQSGIGEHGINSGAFIEAFMEEMHRGLKGEGTLGMIPTYLSCESHLPRGRYAAAIDAGGTNFRTALLYFGENGPEIKDFQSSPMPGTRGRVSWDEFVGTAAQGIKPLLRYTDRIGVCISFPTEIEPDRDGCIRRLTKEVDIHGFEGRHVCRDLLNALGTDGTRATLLNDTSAVLLSALASGADSRGLIGLINGTGTNTCCQLPKKLFGINDESTMIVDIESGSFMPPERSKIDLKLDRHTLAPGIYPEEKLVSGAYLGEICRLALQEAATEGIFSNEARSLFAEIKGLPTPLADSFGSGGAFEGLKAGDDADAAREIVRAVFERAAKHIACTIAAIARFTELEPGAAVTVSGDGSVFRNSTLFRPALRKYTLKYLDGQKVKFIEANNSTLIGTAVAALIGALN